jgi:ABC-type maltose transport system permease subunit
MTNIAFSLCASLACLIIAIFAAVKASPVVALVWALLTVGFVARAAYGYARMRKG